MTAFLRPSTVENPNLRLVMFHHAGGSGSTFFQLCRHLPPDVEVVLHEQPGRGRRHAQHAFVTMPDMVDGVARDLDDLKDDVPLALFGHSLGAIVASELARKLTSEGRPPVWLGVSGRQAPTITPRAAELHLLPDDEFLRTMLDLGGTPQRILEEPEFVRMFLKLARADFSAVDSFFARPDRIRLSCPMNAYAAVDDPWAPPGLMEDWELETYGAFAMTLFEGGHFYFAEGGCAALGRQMAQDLAHMGSHTAALQSAPTQAKETSVKWHE
ncbi:thioesterase II family protein [Palleronia caenipelagi]|uniref:Thioesterase n=1 Tax=Palleronia caenipelagi TaxID=2489174 RepID=A0A547PUJ0_9RHOB|nr:alpha/beta fold hydrolase [Palleronia caenipelagi]TRD17805.1 thioesterase [Palleronia caenipelagi]